MAVQLLPLLARVLGSQFGKQAILQGAALLSGHMMRKSANESNEPDAPPVAGAPQPPPPPKDWNAPGGNRTGAPPVSGGNNNNGPPPTPPGGGNGGGGKVDPQTMLGIVNTIIGMGLLKPPGIPKGNPVRDSLYSIAKPQQVQVAEDLKQTKNETLKASLGTMIGTPKHRVESWLKLQSIVGTMPARIERWGEALHESQRNLMAFNGQIAKSFIERERRGMLRSFDSGKRTAGTTERLGESLEDLKDTLQPYRDLLTNMSNQLITLLTMMAKTGIEIGPKISPILAALQILAKIGEWWYGNQQSEGATFFNQLAKELTEDVKNPNSPVSRRRVKP